MAKNIIPIVAKELGVEINEEFTVENLGIVDGVTFRFTNEELQSKYKDAEWVKSTLSLNSICNKNIVKIPFNPRPGDIYWSYITLGNGWDIKRFYWDGSVIDVLSQYAGCVFRTSEEALAALPEKYKKLTGKEWQE